MRQFKPEVSPQLVDSMRAACQWKTCAGCNTHGTNAHAMLPMYWQAHAHAHGNGSCCSCW